MPAFSVLFLRESDAIECLSATEPDYFHDLNLDIFVEDVVAGRGEYRLEPFFYARLSDTETIGYRQEVLRDLERKDAMACVKRFAFGMRQVREIHARAAKLRGEIQKDGWFLVAVETYCRVAQDLCDDLAKVEPRSRGLKAAREYLGSYLGSPGFEDLREEAARLRAALGSARYCVFIKRKTIRVREFRGESDYCSEIERAFEKFRQGSGNDYRFQLPESPEMNGVERRIAELVAKLRPELFESLSSFRAAKAAYADDSVLAFDRELQFFVSYLDYISLIKEGSLRFSYPAFRAEGGGERSVGLFDIVLARKLAIEGGSAVANDYRFEGPERVIVVTGPNQGGKTTFARAFGQLHHLAALGLCVPGSEAELLLCDSIFTHFEKEERVETLRGKLLDDLLRIRAVLDRATAGSVLILNEMLNSTTLKDAVYLGEKILARVAEIGALCFCVTFIDELAASGEKSVSIASTLDPSDPVAKTFKFHRKPADGLAYAYAVAERYALGYEQIVARIGP